MTRTGLSLHDWDAAIPDLTRYKLNRVYLCVEDRHIRFRQENVHEAIENLQGQGLEVILDPWGVGGWFAGEALGDRPEWTSVERWINFANTTKATGILWDEPTGIDWSMKLSTVFDFSDERQSNLKNIVGLQPERDLFKYASMSNVDEIAVSTYLFPPRINTITSSEIRHQIDEWHATIPRGASVWIQTWGIPAGQEWILAEMFWRWRSLGRDINFWSYGAAATTSSVRSEDYKLVWSIVEDLLTV